MKQVKPTEHNLSLFNDMINHIGDEVQLIDKNGRIVFVNDAVVKGIGYSREYLLGRSIAEFTKEKISVNKWRKEYFEVIRTKKKPFKFRRQRITKNGKVQTLECSAICMKQDGHDYILSVARDVSQSVELHNKVVESEEMYRTLCEQAADGIFLVDPKGSILYANKAATKLFGKPIKNIVGSKFFNFIDKNSVPKAQECFYEVNRGHVMFCSEMCIKGRKHNAIPVEFTSSPIMKNNRVFRIHIIVRDVQQRVQIEALERESVKMKALQNFISGTAHEVHQPLKGLMLRSEALIKEYGKRDFEYIGFKEYKDIIKTLESMSKQSKYCYETIDRLINLNKKKIKIKKSCCVLPNVINDTLGTIAHDLEVHDIKVRVKCASKLPQAGIGMLEFNQVMNNVITNAIQSMPAGGNVDINVTHLKKENLIKVVCKDEGIGIGKDVLPRVFDPFFTTKKRGLEKSSGLGLSIVHSIIKSYKGKVTVHSSLRSGTTVTIFIPVCSNGSRKSP